MRANEGEGNEGEEDVSSGWSLMNSQKRSHLVGEERVGDDLN